MAGNIRPGVIPARSWRRGGSPRRLDVQGLRGVAVFVVVAFHVGLPIPGGFTGVDMFFVISGFVITISLLDMHQTEGGIRLGEFYFRRFMRLIPALALVVLVTLALTWWLFGAVDISGLATTTGLAALGLSANIAIATNSADYFDDPAKTNPLLHTWSLSVEEQFYFVYPLVLIGTLALAQSAKLAKRWATLPLIALIMGSLAIALGRDFLDTDFVENQLYGFYSPISRVWEFGVGALIGLWLGSGKSLGRLASGFFATMGIILLTLSLWGLGPNDALPGPATIVPVAATAALILAGCGYTNVVSRALSSRLLVALGDRSYSLYLWHWPLWTLAQIAAPNEPLVSLGALAISLVAAQLSHRFVETPLRGGNLRELKEKTPLAIALIASPLTLGVIQFLTWERESTQIAAISLSNHSAEVSDSQLVDVEHADIWYPDTVDPDAVIPPFTLLDESNPPSYTDLAANGKPCHAMRYERDFISWCAYGDYQTPIATVALVGDSHAAQWLPALDQIGKERGWRVMAMTAADCAFRRDHPDSADYRDCDEVSQKMLDGVVAMGADLVVTSANSGPEASPPADRFPYWSELDRKNIALVALRNNPDFDRSPSGCLEANLNNPLACAMNRAQYLSPSFSVRDAPSNVALIDLTAHFCDDTLCPSVIDNVLVYRDDDHLTRQFVLYLTRTLEEELVNIWNPPHKSEANEDVIQYLLKSQTIS